MSLAAVRPSSSTRLSPHSSNDHSLRSTRQHPDDSSPSDSFGNLDPQLHPGTLNGVTQEPDLSPQAENRLNDFAQHVLDGHHDALLAFTAGEDGSLFGSNHDHQPFEGLLASQRQDERVEGDDAQDEEYKLEGVEDEKNHDLAGETIPGRTRGGGRKRRREGEEGENGGTTAVLKVKKDSHKEVERRRRENINDGIGEIARLIPGGLEKMGKGTLLRRAAEFMAELAEKVARSDADIAKREVEKSELQNELVHVQNRLADEHARSIRYETSWREAEDRAAGSQFELERVRGELEAPRK